VRPEARAEIGVQLLIPGLTSDEGLLMIEDQDIVEFKSFSVSRREFMYDGKKYWVNVCGPYKDSSYTVEPSWDDDIHFNDIDELIDFMMSHSRAKHGI
jgi:hypothetical protein